MAVDHPLVAVLHRGRPELGRIGPGDLGLGHREERARGALDERAKEALLLLVGAEHMQDLAVTGVGRLAVEDELGPHAAADLLVQQRVLDEAGARAARLRWEVRRPDPGGLRLGAQLRDQRVGRLVLASERGLVRVDVLLHERPHLGTALLHVRLGKLGHQRESAVLEPGSQVQNAIYLAGGAQWPVSAEDWEARAREVLEQGPFDYVAGGAGSESTIRANRDAFERHRLRPRMLVGTAERDLSVEVLGLRSPAPFLLAPVGVLSILHEEKELGVARASKATGVPMILSSAASTSLEDVAAELGDAQRWFQLYWWSDRELAGSLVDRATAAGYGAIVVTLDTLTLGWRDRDLGTATSLSSGGEGLAQFFSDPLFRARLDAAPEEDVQTASLMALAAFPNLGLTWTDLDWLRARTELPILVKGVLRGDDARLALEHGVDGIVVSNHGGRQVDGSIASLDALVEVRDEVGPDATVLMDGGIRRGADVLKALALGADAVLLGRLYAYGLAVGGAAGVEAVIRQLAAELDLTMALAGVRSVRDLDASMVTPSARD